MFDPTFASSSPALSSTDPFCQSGSRSSTQGMSGSSMCECYVTRDLLTEPPTTVCVVPDAATASTVLARAGRSSDTPYVTFADIEPTAGWLSDRNNATLDICFMHSFGKCFGKAKERNSCTCHQIHVKAAVLDNLRRYYKNPQRHYFCRTIKANVSDRFAQVLSLLARRRFSIQYLEFKKENVDVTAGSTAYEVSYRKWLLGETPTTGNKTTGQPAWSFTDNYISEFNLCWDFSLTGRCPKGATCPDIHGHTEKALTKDRHVRIALEELKRKEATLDANQCGCPGGFIPNSPMPRDSNTRAAPVATNNSTACSYKQAVNYGPAVPHQLLSPLPLPQSNAGLRMPTTTSTTGPAAGTSAQNISDASQLWAANAMPPFYTPGYFQPPATPPYSTANGLAALPPPPPPPPQQAASNMAQPFFQQGATSNLPLFFISEGTDNVLRLVPLNGFNGSA